MDWPPPCEGDKSRHADEIRDQARFVEGVASMRSRKVSTQDLPVIFGLTGGIASGKSTVSNMFRELGASVIDADQLARRVVKKGSRALEEIQAAFGEDVITPAGDLNRPRLAEIIFSDANARRELEAITHPRIAAAMNNDAREAKADGHEWVIYDAALIVENGLQDSFKGLIVVTASPETQLERIVDRDELSEDEARARLESQMPLEQKIAFADWIIDNNGSLDATRQQVKNVFSELEKQGREL